MTAVSLVMRSAGVSFNAYLTAKTGSAGIGLFQLVMSVYSLAVTFSGAGIRLAGMRMTVEINSSGRNDMRKSLGMCITYAGICGSVFGFILYFSSGFIGNNLISDPRTALPLRILSLSLPFTAMSSALGGYFTACGRITQYSAVQLLEQGFKIAAVIFLINRISYPDTAYSCVAIVAGMTASEIFSFLLASMLKRHSLPPKSTKLPINLSRILRVAIPDAAGTCARSILLTAEHLLIPEGFKKSGENSDMALSAYGRIHAMAMPLLLYPSAILTSLSALLIPELAKKNEAGDIDGIKRTVVKQLKNTLAFSLLCAAFFAVFAPALSRLVYKSDEAVFYMRILSPLVPVMYLDTVTDGMLKGLDQQIYSMRYNIIDSAFCVVAVLLALPKYAVKGYIMILYASEIINFYLSIGRLLKICGLREFQEPSKGIATFSRLKKCLISPTECGYQKYRGRAKRSQAR